jgi:hypothetical protein
MKFARRVLWVAGIYGLIVIIPGYFGEARTGLEFPPAITHPEYYYGFLGVALAWQVMFLFLAQDPLRYRQLLIPAVLEKVTFGAAVIALLAQHRVPMQIFLGGMMDLLLAVLFVVSYFKLSPAD